MSKRIFFVTAAVLCIASCKTDLPLLHQTKERQPVQVRVEEIKSEAAPDRSSFVGTVVPSKTVTLTSAHSGTLVSLKVAKGDFVRAGQVVAEVKSQTVESAYKVAEANLAQARDGYDRVSRVYPGGGVSEVQYMDIKTKLSQAEAAMESAGKSKSDCLVKAPYDGVVNAVYVDEGVEVLPAVRIATIVDMSGLEIRIAVHENEIGDIRKGEYATVDVPAFGITGLRARVIDRNLLSTTLSHSYECNLRLDNIPSGLLPGMSVKVRFESPGEYYLTVPASAVQLDRNGRYVWIYDEGTVRKSYVTLGKYAGRGVIVSDGLSEGDKVITAGYQKVSTGMKVVAQ